MKNDLRNLGLFLITPNPKKYHFEGVDNVRSAKQLMLIGGSIQVGLLVWLVYGERIKDQIADIRNNVAWKFKIGRYGKNK